MLVDHRCRYCQVCIIYNVCFVSVGPEWEIQECKNDRRPDMTNFRDSSDESSVGLASLAILSEFSVICINICIIGLC